MEMMQKKSRDKQQHRCEYPWSYLWKE